MKFFTSVLCVLLLFISTISYSKTQHPDISKPRKHNYVEHGIASWYGYKFIGHKTASGDRLTTTCLTAAHKTLPLGTVIKVFNKDTNKNIIVTVNDRGPYIKNRVLDLSPAAAKIIGLKDYGIANVTMTVISYPNVF